MKKIITNQEIKKLISRLLVLSMIVSGCLNLGQNPGQRVEEYKLHRKKIGIDRIGGVVPVEVKIHIKKHPTKSLKISSLMNIRLELNK